MERSKEVEKNKKKIDKAIQERDTLIEKYVPDIKKLGLEGNAHITPVKS